MFLCRAWFEPDVWYHLALGRAILETGQPQPPELTLLVQPNYVNIYWLFQLAAYGVYRLGGVAAVTLAVGLLWAATAALWARTSGAPRLRILGPWLALAALLLAEGRFQRRPEVVSYLLLALHVRWHLALDARRRVTAADLAKFAASQVVWTNVHGYFLFGPLLALLHLGAAAAPGRRGAGTGRALPLRGSGLLLAAVSLASFATPFGAGAWRMVSEYAAFGRAMRHEIGEFQPLFGYATRYWIAAVFLALWLVTLALTLHRLRRDPRDPFVAGLALLGLAVSAMAARNVPLLFILGAPLWRPAPPPEASPQLGARFHRLSCAAAALVASALAVWAATDGYYRFLGASVRTGIGLLPTAYPAGFLRHVESSPFEGRIFNHPNDGGFLLFHLPALRLYGDSRFSDVAKVREYFAALGDPAAFFALDRRERFDGVLLNIVKGQEALLPHLLYASWSVAYADLSRAFLVRGEVPLSVVRIYAGENLSLLEEGSCATRWVSALAAAEYRPLLALALAQLEQAPAVPSAVVVRVLQAGLGGSDPALLSWGERMAPRALSRSPAESAQLAELLAAARAGLTAPRP